MSMILTVRKICQPCRTHRLSKGQRQFDGSKPVGRTDKSLQVVRAACDAEINA